MRLAPGRAQRRPRASPLFPLSSQPSGAEGAAQVAISSAVGRSPAAPAGAGAEGAGHKSPIPPLPWALPRPLRWAAAALAGWGGAQRPMGCKRALTAPMERQQPLVRWSRPTAGNMAHRKPPHPEHQAAPRRSAARVRSAQPKAVAVAGSVTSTPPKPCPAVRRTLPEGAGVAAGGPFRPSQFTTVKIAAAVGRAVPLPMASRRRLPHQPVRALTGAAAVRLCQILTPTTHSRLSVPLVPVARVVSAVGAAEEGILVQPTITARLTVSWHRAPEG